MPPDLHQQFKSLLIGLPLWSHREGREQILACLRGEELWEHRLTEGDPATCASHLLNLYDSHGPAPYLVLLASLRDTNQAATKILAKINALENALRIPRPRVPWNSAPYRGLLAFDRRHSPIFFGRDTESDALFRSITAIEPPRRLTVVLGASGSGKSSLVRAGLWPRIAATHPGWLVSAMTPLQMGTPATSLHASLVEALKDDRFEDKRDCLADLDTAPLTATAEKLLCDAPPTARWLLILDQMEELFTHPGGSGFLDRLLAGTHQPSRFQIVATLRADFYHHCLTHPPLLRALELPHAISHLRPPGRLALERMVSGPIVEVDLPQPWTLDPDLPSTIAADAERQSGGLALMAFALRELYERCNESKNTHLDVDRYRSPEFGGLSGAIARCADKAFGTGDVQTLGRVFTRLVRVDHDDAPTRLRASSTAWDTDADGRQLVDKFVTARLLVADAGIIEVAHEALLREWPTLANWIDQRKDAFQLANRVRTEAKAWQQVDHTRPWTDRAVEETRSKLAQADLLTLLEAEDPKIERLLTPEVDWILDELQFADTSHFRRRDIGQRLAQISDPRPGVGLTSHGLPDIRWCSIPKGKGVKPFQMSAFPVTAFQFRSFLDAKDGYEDQRWWHDLEKPDQRGSAWEKCLNNHPVTDVSWFDAVAFCRWLSSAREQEVRLPSEKEWEWSATSGRHDFAYPWGPEWREGFANTSESDINRTTAVGMYPQGNSLQGVSDLAGNVWEWCEDWYDDKKQSRVLRGGSWYYISRAARADYRYRYVPDFRDFNFGFRVVCSSPITGPLTL